MTFTTKFYRGFIAIAAAALVSVSAFAQSTILIVDQAKILRESEVGKHIQRQVDSIGNTMKNELQSAASPLKSEGATLEAEIKALGASPDMSSRPDLQSRFSSFVQKSQKQQVEARYKQQELVMTEAKAYQKVNEKLEGILKTIVAERNADVVIDRSAVIYGKPADVTDVVMSRLNSQMRTVPVTRERIPRKQ